MRPRNASESDLWIPFFWAAVLLAIIPGFGLGGALFFLPTTGGVPSWWPTAARVHGHIQLVGWAGLMVLGVGLHFLPRLRGRPLAHPEQARTALRLLVAGLALRLFTEPALASGQANAATFFLQTGLISSGLLELAGVTVAIGLLALTLRGSPPWRTRSGLVQVLPVLATALAGFWLATLANLAAVAYVALDDAAVGASFDRASVLVALYLFLIPISVGMGARVFPLHFAARQADRRLLRIGLVALVFGVLLRQFGEAAGVALPRTVGSLLLGVALVLFLVGLRIFAARRAVPGQRPAWYVDPAQWHGITAAAWLGVDALVLAVGALSAVTSVTSIPPGDAERHILGTGFVTLLILGEGANLLPGFARRPLRTQVLVWTTLVLGNLAAILRVGPVLLPGLFPRATGELLLASAGLFGLIAILAFAINLGRLPARPRIV